MKRITSRICLFFLCMSATGFLHAQSVFSTVAAEQASLSLLQTLRSHPESDAAGLAVKRWETDYPQAPLKSRIYYTYASLHFEEGDYRTCLDYLLKTDIQRLEKDIREEARFKKAYALFSLNRTDQAVQLFRQLEKAKDPQVARLAQYYHAYICYLKQDFATAATLFEALQPDAAYARLAPLYVMECRYYLGQYDRVIAMGEDLYASAAADQKPAISRLLSESFFAVGQTDKAEQYYETYRLLKTTSSREDDFYAGNLYYALRKYHAAAEAFERVAATPDSLGQSARYHLGKAYMELKNKQAAMDNFRQAADLDFNPALQEDAYFNYAKAAFDTGGDVQAIRHYCETYDNPQKEDELLTYTAQAYLMQKDYQNAIEVLQSISRPTTENRHALQRADLLRGLQLIEAGAVRQAQIHFREAAGMTDGEDATAQLALDWSAEAFYADADYARAREAWQRLGTPKAAYGIGYAWFMEKEYDKALASFETAVAQPGITDEQRRDAMVRIADCYFMKGRYSEALEHYRTTSGDYALYQKAFALGLLNRAEEKLDALQALLDNYPQSGLIAAALFEKGRTYVQMAANEKAILCFRQLSALEDETWQSRALVELGLIALNQGKTAEAMEKYKTVVSQFRGTQAAEDALAGIENIYQMQNDSQGFFDYLGQLGLEERKSADEKENMLFAAAEKSFLAKLYEDSVTKLEQFLTTYPHAKQRQAALFYLGESLRELNRFQQAADRYLQVTEDESGAYTELATLQFARLQYKLQNFASAAQAYESLRQTATTENNRQEAQLGRMRSYFRNKDYEQATASAKEISETNWAGTEEKREAAYVSAKSYLALSRREEALPFLKTLAKEPQYAQGAEATYLLCKDAFESGRTDEAETMIYNFADSDTPQQYWLAQSFILLGDLFAHRENYKQALATYQSILDGYQAQGEDDIVSLVQHRIEQCREKMNK